MPRVKLLDDTEPERWAELGASDNIFALVVMAQIRAKVTDDAKTLKGWRYQLRSRARADHHAPADQPI